jgi:uncharacterized protein
MGALLSVGQFRPEMPPDACLVREARSGCKEAMAELLRRHWDIAVLLAGRVLGSPDLASVSADPAEAAETADTAARVRGAIAALAPRLVQFTALPEVCTVTATEEAAEWTEVVVSEIRRTSDKDLLQRKHVMVLAERGGDRRLPIWIGPAEATALALVLESVETPRPFSYKLAAGLVEAAGSQITEVKITRLLNSVFYACVVVQGPGGPREVDARPSDAVNLAVASGAPIRLNSELFSAAMVHDDGEEPSSYPVATADIAAEAQQLIREAAQRLAQRPAPQPGRTGA